MKRKNLIRLIIAAIITISILPVQALAEYTYDSGNGQVTQVNESPLMTTPLTDSNFTYYGHYTSNKTWTVTESGWYRLYAIGAGGNGEDGKQNGSSYHSYGQNSNNEWNDYFYCGGSAGGSGGIAVSQYWLSKGDIVNMGYTSGTATVTIGNKVMSGVPGNGRTGGKGSGGNIANIQAPNGDEQVFTNSDQTTIPKRGKGFTGLAYTNGISDFGYTYTSTSNFTADRRNYYNTIGPFNSDSPVVSSYDENGAISIPSTQAYKLFGETYTNSAPPQKMGVGGTGGYGQHFHTSRRFGESDSGWSRTDFATGAGRGSTGGVVIEKYNQSQSNKPTLGVMQQPIKNAYLVSAYACSLPNIILPEWHGFENKGGYASGGWSTGSVEVAPEADGITANLIKSGTEKETNWIIADIGDNATSLENGQMLWVSGYYRESASSKVQLPLTFGGFYNPDGTEVPSVILASYDNHKADGEWQPFFYIVQTSVAAKNLKARIVEWPESSGDGSITINGLQVQRVPSGKLVSNAHLKWAQGEQNVSYFKTNGTSLGSGVTFTVPAKGAYSVYMIDDDGNELVRQLRVMNLIPQAPQITVTPDKEWVNGSDHASFTLAKGIEDIDNPDIELLYQIDNGIVGSEGQWETYNNTPIPIMKSATIKAKAQFRLNSSDEVTKKIGVDDIVPVIGDVVFSEDLRKVKISVSDAGGSTLKGLYIGDTLHSAVNGTVDYLLPKGTFTISLQAEDMAGNKSAVRSETAPDKTPPVITNVLFSEDATTVTITATDNASGFKGVYLNGLLHLSTDGITVTAPIATEVYRLQLEAIDNMDNRATARIETVPDVIPPVIDSCVFENGGLSATIMASDKGSSGLKGTYVNGELFTGSKITYSPPKGIYKLTLQAEDNAGNKSPDQVETVPDTLAPIIESVTISSDAKIAEIVVSDSGGSGINGVSINGTLCPGSRITYAIPEGTRYLEIQAEDNIGNLSERIKKRVPGWSEIVDTITIEPVVFSENNTRAKITALTSRADTSITGIFVNDVLHTGSPVNYKVPAGITTMQLQAVNNEGDKSVVYTLDIPSWLGGVRIASVNFSKKNDEAIIKAVDDTGIGIKGIYVNDELFEGDTIVYSILYGTTHLQIQAVNQNGDTSDVLIKRVPGWSEITDTLTITTVDISPEGTLATVAAESIGAAVSGIYVNDKLFAGNPILYSIPSGMKTLKLQAENMDGDKSPVVYREVKHQTLIPSIVETLIIKSITLTDKIATITAESTDSPISGIYVNDKLYEGNPVLFPVTSSIKTIKAQAVNANEERSPVIYKEVNLFDSSSSSPPTVSGKKPSISIVAPGWTNANKAKVKINVTARNGIDIVEAKTSYGYEADISDQDYLYITEDTAVTVNATDENGAESKKTVEIACFDRESPTVSVSQTDNALKIRTADKKSGVVSIIINGKSFNSTGGEYRYEMPDNVSVFTIQAEDKAGNSSDPLEYHTQKPITVSPIPMATTTTVTPTPTPTPTNREPISEPVPELVPEATPEPLPEAPTVEEESNSGNKAAAVAGILAVTALAVAGGILIWHNHQKAQQLDGFESLEDLDLDLDYESESDLEDEEDPDAEQQDAQEINFNRRKIG